MQTTHKCAWSQSLLNPCTHLVQLPELLYEPGVHLRVFPDVCLRQPVLKALARQMQQVICI